MSRPPPLPEDVAGGVAEALGNRGAPDPIVDASPLGGGCIHPAARITSAGGRTAFLKWAPDPGTSGFDVEARGLTALSERGGVRIPDVLGHQPGDTDRRGWLLLELVIEGPSDPGTPRRLGEGLAHLHRPEAGWAPGWDEHGRLATLSQPNPPGLSWPRFWAEARILPRWRQVRSAFTSRTRDLLDAMVSDMDTILAGWEEDGMSLLHGDLWSGNVLTDRTGEPVLVDPAVYRGHREVDLAMMELFGGFAADVFSVYGGSAPLAPGYRERRRDAYQLYPLLVHVELFGSGYLARTEACIRRLANG